MDTSNLPTKQRKPVNPTARRQDYLLGLTGAGLRILAGILTFCIGTGALVFFFWPGMRWTGPGLEIVRLLFAAVSLIGLRLVYTGVKEGRSVPYVPRVVEQIEALPPEEVLVRGSHSPMLAKEELLRPLENTRE